MPASILLAVVAIILFLIAVFNPTQRDLGMRFVALVYGLVFAMLSLAVAFE